MSEVLLLVIRLISFMAAGKSRGVLPGGWTIRPPMLHFWGLKAYPFLGEIQQNLTVNKAETLV